MLLSPSGPGVKTLGPQLVTLFGTVMEPLRGGALLEEASLWGPDLSIYSLALLLVLCLSLSPSLPTFLLPSLPHPSISFSRLPAVVQVVSSQHACPSRHLLSPLWNQSPNMLFASVSCLGHGV